MKNQKSLRIFILADDAWHGSMLEQHVSLNPDYEVKRFESAEIFFQHLREQPDVIAIDCPVNGVEGIDLLRRIKSELPRVQVIVIAGKEEAANCVQLLKQGAFEYIVKDDTMQDRLWNTLLHLQEIITLRYEVTQLKEGSAPVNAEANGNGLSQLFYKEISLREYECQIIQYYLEKYNKDVLLVAKKLDIGKSTIYRMIQNGELRKGVA
ncbi:MAG TPA: response regulator [Chitinophagaceae bacterium]|nr:response regulator [Chitinophagaceae bacterium]